MSMSADPIRERLPQVRRIALVTGGGALALSLIMALFSSVQFLPSYLVAYLYFVGVALGALALICLHNLVGGGWGWAIRRPLEAAAMTIIPLAVLFVPIVIGAGSLYPWVRPTGELVELLAHKRSYLSVGWFAARSLLYFAIWIGLAVAFQRLSARQDRTADTTPSWWMQSISGPGLLIMFLTMTFAAIDWAMSLEPAWYSTIYGAMLIIGWGLTTFALMILAIGVMAPHPPVAANVTPNRLNDLGNLMMAFLMLWAYMSFSQFLIMWSGNLAEEAPWYLKRSGAGWRNVAIFLIVFHFFAPFLVLLFRETKRHVRTLMSVAAAIAVVHLVDICWLILPARIEDPLAPFFPWSSVLAVPVAFLGIGGLAVASWTYFLEQSDLVPRHQGALATASTLAAAHGVGGH